MNDMFSQLLQVTLIACSGSLVAFLLALTATQCRLPTRGFFRRRQKKLTEARWLMLAEYKPETFTRFCFWAGFAPKKIKNILGLILAAGVVAGFIFSQTTIFLIMLAIAASVVAFIVYRAHSSRKRFVMQLPDALDALVASLRAGYSIAHAFGIVSRETRWPAKEIFGALSRANDYHIPLQNAVRMLNNQLSVQEWSLVSETLEIQGNIGGNIIPVIVEMTRTLRDKIRVDQEVATATASGRFSGLLIAALAPISLVAFLIFSPSYINVLTNTGIGKMLLSLAGLLELVGFFVIWKLVTIEY